MSILEDQSQKVKYQKIALVGNPNVGKSVIFNQLTGINQKIANFPGITLSYLKGKLKGSSHTDIVDLPGIYGFVSSKAEEKLTLQYLMHEKPDIIFNIIDARKLERNLALTLQLLEFDIPMIIIITHRDKISQQTIDLELLQSLLNIPVFSINAHNKKEYTPIFEQIAEPMLIYQVDHRYGKLNLPQLNQLNINEQIMFQGQQLLLNPESSVDHLPLRLLLILTILAGKDQIHLLPSWLLSRLDNCISQVYSTTKDRHTIQMDIITSYSNSAQKIVEDVVSSDYTLKKDKIATKIDYFLLHPIYGIIIFIIMMYSMFSLSFIVTEPAVNALELAMESLATFIYLSIDQELLASFLADGIVGGVGFVLVFIPQIAMLFLFIGLLEHSGYLSRAVFITDKYLEKIGISGTSIAPMLLGFGCNVPGLMATKSISDPNERLAVGLTNPFMSCSARLPVYMIIASAIFPSQVGLVVTSLYLLGIIIAVLVMYTLRKTVLPGESQFLILEIPELQIPKTDAILKEAYRHTRKFIENAASWMALGLLLIWLLSITGPNGYLGPEALDSTELVKQSWIYFLGDFLSPIFSPLGWDPRLIVALILGFIAKEIVIGSLGLLYGVASSNLETVLLMSFTPISAYAFLVFVLIYTPCIGTYITMRSQLGKKWANISIVMSLILAYLLALLVTIIGNFLLLL